MILYRNNTKTFAIETLSVNLQDDVLAAVRLFEPEFIMAETAAENHMILKMAAHAWAGLGLIEPTFEQLQADVCHSESAKVFLLNAHEQSNKPWDTYGLVVHNWDAYQAACLEALNNVLT